jgi:hypothetical protein
VSVSSVARLARQADRVQEQLWFVLALSALMVTPQVYDERNCST